MVYLELIAGLVLLAAGGDFLVRGAVAVARRIGVSELMIGLTLVGFGTSIPELATSVEAVLLDAPGIALGNVVGSNVANTLLVLGVGALITPVLTGRRALARDGPALLGATLLMVLVCQLSAIGRGIGAVFMLLLTGYTAWTYRTERQARPAPVESDPDGLGRGVGSALAGLAGVLVGAALLVDAAIAIARLWQLSEAIVGITVVAFGTSVPELAIMLAAAGRARPDLGFGNVVGSNLFNILGITGATALVRPLPVPAEVAHLHVWIMLGATVFLVLFARTEWRITRLEGSALIGAYAAYVVFALV